MEASIKVFELVEVEDNLVIRIYVEVVNVETVDVVDNKIETIYHWDSLITTKIVLVDPNLVIGIVELIKVENYELQLEAI